MEFRGSGRGGKLGSSCSESEALMVMWRALRSCGWGDVEVPRYMMIECRRRVRVRRVDLSQQFLLFLRSYKVSLHLSAPAKLQNLFLVLVSNKKFPHGLVLVERGGLLRASESGAASCPEDSPAAARRCR